MYWLEQHALIVGGVLMTALAVIFVLQQRRTPQSTAAWVLFLVLVPYLAIPLFLMLGFRKKGSRFHHIELSSPAAEALADTEKTLVLSNLGAPSPTKGNVFVLHEDAEMARKFLHETIDAATKELDILFYLLAPDETGRFFVDKLTKRAKAGVKVRLNLDRLGTLSRPKGELKRLEAAGGEVRFFSPFLHPPDSGHMNLRNHRKLVIADRSKVWSGGRNIGDHYLTSGEGAWTDLSFSLSGPAVQVFAETFASDWDVTGNAVAESPLCHAKPVGDAVLQVVPSGPDEPRDILYLAMTTLIHRARRRVWIASPYFVPTEPLQLALASATHNGVDVRILIPERSNQKTADLARGPYLRELQEQGALVLRHQGGMLHAKAGLIDDLAWVGSANFDVRSLLLNFELAMFCHDGQSREQIEQWFSKQFEQSEKGISQANLRRRVVEGIFRLGAPVL